MPDWLQIALGILCLIAGADLLVRGAVWVALVMGIRPMIVGLTVVAFGTSAPELVASLTAASSGAAGIAMGTVLGSNLANLLLILGLVALVRPIRSIGQRIAFESNYLILMTVMTAVPFIAGEVAAGMGMALLSLLVLFTWQLIRREKRASPSRGPATPRGRGPWFTHLMFLILGVAGLNYGGHWLVEGARSLALDLGMSDVFVGMTVVAIGTSLPELAASVLAARRGHPELCLGNIIGSNIFNVGMVLGVTATIHPLPLSWAAEGPPMVAGLIAMAAVVFVLRRYRGLPRWTGPVMLVAYGGYLTFEILRV